MSKDVSTPAIDPDEALRLLAEALSYFTPAPVRPPARVEYEEFPLAA